MYKEFVPQVIPYPGKELAEKLEEIQMGPKEFAVRTGKPEKTITAILKGESSITAEMAVSFESVLQIPAHYWLNLQRNYDEFRAREKRKNAIADADIWVKKLPIKDMIKLGWMPQSKTSVEKTLQAFSFFGISNHKAWEEYYCNQTLKVAFRISLKSTGNPYAVSAWLRKGELQADSIDTKKYSALEFRNRLSRIKKLMAEQPADFFQQLQEICSSAGVKVIPTPSLPGAPVNGATRWIKDNPVIQLSGRYKRNDIFWFTFFHEAGHILLHGKKDIFIEIENFIDQDQTKESEADDFAVKWTLSPEEEDAILQSGHLTNADIIKYANKYNTHPAMIIGRLQYKKIIPHTSGHQFIKPININT